MHEHQSFSDVAQNNPDRFEKADLAETSISILDDGEFVVQRSPDEDSHRCELVLAFGQPWGSCSCDGYQYHDGPCSHLCAIWRAYQMDLTEVPGARVERIKPAVGQQPLPEATDDDVHRVVPDGGEIDAPPAGHDGRVFGRPEGQL